MNARKPKKQVYVSSTFSDLEHHRAALKSALERAGYDVECMEKYPAFDERPLDKCLADVTVCDFYVLVLALRYGFVPPDNNLGGVSITEMEYAKAIEAGHPCLVFLLDDNHPWPPKLCDSDWQEDGSRISRFRQKVGQNHGRTLFTTAESLESQVLQALRLKESQDLSSTERAFAEIRSDYFDWLRKDCESVELLGLDLKESQNVRLGQIYVPAITAQNIQEEDVRLRGGRNVDGVEVVDLKKPPFLLLKMLGRSSLYVPGAPGAGKSTFCRWLALAAVGNYVRTHPIGLPERFHESLPETLHDRFPVLCRLRELAGYPELLVGRGRWNRIQLEASLSGWIDVTRPGELTGEIFRKELAEGRCLLILDGVDEVPEVLGEHYPRLNLLSGLADALPSWRAAGNWLILTSRPYGLSSDDQRSLGLPIAGLSELPDDLQNVFVRRWYAAADPARATEKALGLLAHLAEREDLLELRRNPMLLTALCVKYDEGQRLPQDFYRLYDAVVTQVLYKRYPTESLRERVRNRLAAIALGMHQGPKNAPRKSPEAEATLEEVDAHLADLLRTDLTTEAGAAASADLREDLLSSSGLLLPRADRRAGFYHLSFQEFLAAVRLHRLRESPDSILQRYAATRAWHRTLKFLFCAIADRESPEMAISAYESLLSHLKPSELEKNSGPALLLVDCLEVAHGRGWNLDKFSEPLRQACRHALHDLPVFERVYLWLSLGRLGLDNRPGVGVCNDGMPNIDWVEVPGGEFLFGESCETRYLPSFCISRYPVTNCQFDAFVADGGYVSDEWWEGLSTRFSTHSGCWHDPNAPCETVSWIEAVAYSRWLDARLRQRSGSANTRIRLPTDEEWEKAARGTDGRIYPWGSDFNSSCAHIGWRTDELRRTTPVGMFLQGCSPCGGLDMGGNVWEWCISDADAVDLGVELSKQARVARGGGWRGQPIYTRCADSGVYPAGRKDDNLGFRLVRIVMFGE